MIGFGTNITLWGPKSTSGEAKLGVRLTLTFWGFMLWLVKYYYVFKCDRAEHPAVGAILKINPKQQKNIELVEICMIKCILEEMFHHEQFRNPGSQNKSWLAVSNFGLHNYLHAVIKGSEAWHWWSIEGTWSSCCGSGLAKCRSCFLCCPISKAICRGSSSHCASFRGSWGGGLHTVAGFWYSFFRFQCFRCRRFLCLYLLVQLFPIALSCWRCVLQVMTIKTQIHEPCFHWASDETYGMCCLVIEYNSCGLSKSLLR